MEKCDKIKSLFGAYLHNDATSAERAAVEEHITTCKECAVDLQNRQEELRQRILQATEELSPRQRKAFVLCRYSGMPLKDAAENMGCPIGTIKAHLNRATAKMRDRLGDL